MAGPSRTRRTTNTRRSQNQLNYASTNPSLATQATQEMASSDHVSASALGAGMKELLQGVNKLESLGLENLSDGIQLPRIVAIGDQSAGKSSTIEAISEIRVPRSAGTCTRCPFHINLTESIEAWKCSVEIRWDFVRTPRRNSRDTYPNFAAQMPVTIPFGTITTRGDLENLLHRAQLAVLHPSKDPQTYLTGPVPGIGESDDAFEVPFSPNPIIVHVAGPGLPNLSLVDTPGVITQTEDGRHRDLPKVIQTLVKEYIKPKNTLVLLACSLESDIANSNASSIMRQVNAQHRTIGILTKPDRLPSGDPLTLLKQIITGTKYPLRKYFVTKQPTSTELATITHLQARAAERDVFASSDPWCTELAPYASQFGTLQLQETLCKDLAGLISTCLPHIHSLVEEKLHHIDARLRDIPAPATANAVHLVIHKLTKFAEAVGETLEGKPPANVLQTEWRKIKKQLKDDLYSMRPILIVSSPGVDSGASFSMAKAEERSSTRESITIDSDDESNHRVVVSETPTKKRKINGTTALAGASAPSTPQKVRTMVNGGRYKDDAKRYKLDQVRDLIKSYSTSNIPNKVDPSVIQDMITNCLDSWYKATEALLQSVEKALSSHIRTVFQHQIGPFERTEFYKMALESLNNFTRVYLDIQRNNVIPQLLKLERYKACTEDEEIWEYHCNKELEIFRAARFRNRANEYWDQLQRSTGKEISHAERQKKLASANDRELRAALGPDPYDIVITTMAKVRGYYNIASARLCDNICMAIQRDLFHRLMNTTTQADDPSPDAEKGLLDAIMTDLNARDHASCIRLLAEHPEREALRQRLVQEKAALVAAQTTLNELGSKYKDTFPTLTASNEDQLMDEEEEDGTRSPLEGYAGGRPQMRSARGEDGLEA